VKKPVYKIGEFVFYYNKWNNEIENGEVINLRQSNLNWDYTIRYRIYNDLCYIHWIEEKYIGRDEQSLYKFLK